MADENQTRADFNFLLKLIRRLERAFAGHRESADEIREQVASEPARSPEEE